MAHHLSLPAYRTDGVYLCKTTIGLYEPVACPDQTILDVAEGIKSLTTAAVLMGASGGPMINDRGELVGVISMVSFRYTENFSFLVPLDSIHKFLENK